MTPGDSRETIRETMRRLAAIASIGILTLLAAAAIASSQPLRFNGELRVSVVGWGGVKLGKGVLEHITVHCTRAHCPAVSYLTRGAHARLVAKPYQGWRFYHWRGACKSKRPVCVVNVARVRADANGVRHIHVSAAFVPAAPGLTRDHPIPLGTNASVGEGWRVQVNSVIPNAQLVPAAPTGEDYFAANVTIGYFGGDSSTPENDLIWQSIGRYHTPYNPGANPCPNLGPQPPLDTYNAVPSGQSRTGYVCWQIAENDAGSLELYFGSGTLSFPATTWFALH